MIPNRFVIRSECNQTIVIDRIGDELHVTYTGHSGRKLRTVLSGKEKEQAEQMLYCEGFYVKPDQIR